MSCSSCSSSFGLLKKEVGCQLCGFAVCTKCCSRKSITKDSGETIKKLVCNKCYNNLTSNKTPTASGSPPSAYKKRVAMMNNRSMSLGTNSWSNEKDKEIAERLQKLKRERSKEVHATQDEIEERLAKLKGMDPAKYTAPPIMVYRPHDKLSADEQAGNLMKQIAEEVQIDAKQPKPEEEIAARLAKLRGEPPPAEMDEELIQPMSYIGVAESSQEEMNIEQENRLIAEQYKTLAQQAQVDIQSLEKTKEYKDALQKMKQKAENDSEEKEDVDEDEEADRIVQQLLAVKMDSTEMDDPKSMNGSQMPSTEDTQDGDESDEEFPWCVICTEDAKMRCFGCDNDLYCMNCFRECHDSLDIKDHKTCPFLSPKKM